MAQLEIGTHSIGPALIDFFANGRAAEPGGNADGLHDHVPNDVFATTDGFVAISVTDDDQWPALIEIVGDSLSNPALEAEVVRREHRQKIHAALDDWASQRSGAEAMRVLQRVGVPAGKVQDAAQATQFPRDHRPWGWFESLVTGSRFQVKRIVVKPGAALSLQSHHHRSEHWIVVEGTARVTIDDTVKLVTENQSVYIPLGATHRMENPGKLPMVLIEVQTGAYLGEDDILRLEDVYART